MTASARRCAVEWRRTYSASGSCASRVVSSWKCSPSDSGSRRSRTFPSTRASTACSASFGPIARAASSAVAPSGSSSSDASGSTTFMAREDRRDPWSSGLGPTLSRMSDAAEPAGRVERLARRPLEHVGGVVRGVARALPKAIEDMFTDRCTQYAAAIAYRVLFSLFPLTIALVSIFGLVLQDDALRQKVINELIDLLPV